MFKTDELKSPDKDTSIEQILAEDKKPKDSKYLSDILELLVSEENKFAILKDKEPKDRLLEDLPLIVEEPKDNKILLYQLNEDKYLVYVREEEDERKKKARPRDKYALNKDYGLYIPTGVVVQRVSQNILGNGVLGRAFIGQNYIEILDSLVGDAYMEVLTHEVFHIQYPEKREMEIRHMTRNYIGDRAIYH